MFEVKMLNKVYRTERIIQFGEGAFLRGFFDWILQLVNEASDFDASAVVVQPIEKGLCQRLEAQGCVYTHVMRGLKAGVPTVEKKVIDVISRTVEPYADFESYLALAEKESFRFVVSNTTEAGIAFDSADTPGKAPYVTFPAKVTLLLKRRYDLGLPGFVFLPCELIDKNGSTLKKYILEYARLWGFSNDFCHWIDKNNVFCNTLVDRIVTGYPKDEDLCLGYADAMLNTSELFHLWVIETDHDIKSEIPFDKAGVNVIVTEDLERYRTRKVRILNGAHTAMIPYALLEGVETVGDCMDDEKLSSHVKACVYDEIIPTLDLPYNELKDYADNVFERFGNVYIRHLCSSIALNSVSKFKVRVLPSILEYRRRFGKSPDRLMLSFAKLIEFYRTDMTNDSPSVCEAMRSVDVNEILRNKELWGEDISYLCDDLKRAMN
jgi:tagaturonate reductase